MKYHLKLRNYLKAWSMGGPAIRSVEGTTGSSRTEHLLSWVISGLEMVELDTPRISEIPDILQGPRFLPDKHTCPAHTETFS